MTPPLIRLSAEVNQWGLDNGLIESVCSPDYAAFEFLTHEAAAHAWAMLSTARLCYAFIGIKNTDRGWRTIIKL